MSNCRSTVRFKSYLVPSVLYLLCLCLHFYPYLLEIDKKFLGGGLSDPGIYIWLIRHNIEHVFTYPTNWFDAKFFYPFGNALSFTDNFLFPSLLAWPLFLFTNNTYIIVNVLILFTFYLNAYLCYLLAYEITKHRLASFASGFLFMYFPFFIDRLGHTQLLFAFFLPAVLLSIIKYFKRGSLVSAFFIGCSIFLAFCSSIYIGIFTAILAVVAFTMLFIAHCKAFSIRDMFKVVIANVPSLIAIFMISTPYIATRESFDTWSHGLIKKFSAKLIAYISAPWQVKMWGFTHNSSYGEGHYFGGLIPLLSLFFCFVYLISKYKNEDKRLTGLLLTTLLVTVCLIFIDFFHLTNTLYYTKVSLHWATLVLLLYCFYLSLHNKKVVLSSWMFFVLFCFYFFVFLSLGIISDLKSGHERFSLYTILVMFFPGLDSLRGINRAALVAIFSLCLIFAGSIKVILDSKYFKTYRLRSYLFLLVILTGVYIETLPTKVKLGIIHRRPFVFDQLAGQKDDGAVIVLPFAHSTSMHFATQHTEYMHWTQVSTHAIVNGYSGKIPPFHQNLGAYVKNFPDTKSINHLARVVNLKYIVFCPFFQPKFKKKKFKKLLKPFVGDLNIITPKAKGGFLFDFHPTLDVFYEDSVPEVLVIPETHRTRTLKAKLSCPHVHLEEKLKFVAGIGYKDKKEIKHAFTIGNRSRWNDVSIELPKSESRVRPHKIVFYESSCGMEAGDVLLKYIRVK